MLCLVAYRSRDSHSMMRGRSHKSPKTNGVGSSIASIQASYVLATFIVLSEKEVVCSC